jgi:hypothetical protein
VSSMRPAVAAEGAIWLGVNSLTRHVQVELEDDDADSSCAILLVPTSVIAPLLSLGPKHG